MLESLLAVLCRYRRTTLLAAAVLLVAGAALASRLAINDSAERWMPASSVEAWRRFEEHYDYGDTVAIALQFHRPVRDGDIELLTSIRRELLAIDGVARVTDASLVAGQIEGVPLTEFLRTPGPGEKDPFGMYRGILFDDPRLREGAGEGGEESPHPLPLSQRERGDGDLLPLSQEERGGNESRTLLTFIEAKPVPTGPGQAMQEEEVNARRRAMVTAIYRVLDEHHRDDVTYYAVGAIVIQHELEKIARQEVLTTVPAALAMIVAVLGLGFRSWGAVALVLLGGLWSIAVMLGGISAAGWTMNVVTVGGPTLLAVIAVTTTIHFAHYYASHKAAAKDPLGEPVGGDSAGEPSNSEHAVAVGGASHSSASDKDASHKDASRTDNWPHFVRWVGVPCLGVAVVTGVGFLMLAFNELSPARELGIELFAGAILAFFGAFLAWLWIHPFRAGPARWLTASGFCRWNGWITSRPWTATLSVTVVMAAAAVAACWVRVDVDPFAFFQPGSRVARALHLFSERKFGLYVLDVVLIPRDQSRGPEERAADRRAALRLQQEIARRPEVRNVVSALDLQARAGGFDMANPRDWKRAMAFLDTFIGWTRDKAGQDAVRISFMVYDDGRGFAPLVEDLKEHLQRPEIRDRFDVVYTGTASSVVTLSANLVGGISRGLWTAAAVMALLCLALFRSVRLMLVAVLPNAFPVVVVFGVMGLFGVPLNSGSAMVASIALGIALNDTIHFVMHYQRRRAMGETADEALADTFAALGRPLVMTSVVNSLGFGVFLLSDFRPMFHFGMLASVSMAAALVGDVVLLPNMLKLADRNGDGAGGGRLKKHQPLAMADVP